MKATTYTAAVSELNEELAKQRAANAELIAALKQIAIANEFDVSRGRQCAEEMRQIARNAIQAQQEVSTTKTEQEARIEFAHYFLDLEASLKREGEGAKADKHQEWENFIAHLVEEGDLPAEAKSWTCPRSLEAEIRKQQA